jgi:hypothetical protein
MEIVVLRLVHVLGGIFWVGSVLFNSFFLFPALAQAGPAAGAVMGGLRQRGFLLALPVSALLTILSGARLMWIASAGFAPGYFGSPVGRVYLWSGIAAILAFLIGLFISRPAAARAAQPGLTQLELAGLRRRVAISGAVVTVLLLVTAAGMAIGRYA